MRKEDRLTTEDWDKVIHMHDVELLSFLEISQAFGGGFSNGYFAKGCRRRKNQLAKEAEEGGEKHEDS